MLRAFESWHKEYGPTVFYAHNLSRVDVVDLFRETYLGGHQRIVLATSAGKYIVTKSPELRIADASGSPLRCIAAEMGVGETETLYLYAFAADCAQFAWLQIGDEQIALLKAE